MLLTGYSFICLDKWYITLSLYLLLIFMLNILKPYSMIKSIWLTGQINIKIDIFIYVYCQI